MRQKGEGVIGILLLLAVICAVLGVLSGCTAVAESQADYHVARYGPYCTKLGYQEGSDGWRDCVAQRR
jgi:hypothetical protein